jgi:predicted AAA+ superfamily ATPase
MEVIRSTMQQINWEANLIAVRGSRGVGKSTLLRQYIKLHYPMGSREALYCTLDSIYFAQHSLLSFAEEFYQHGGKHLFLDEVHKYEGWSREVKEIHDLYPNLKLVLSGSSILNILSGDVDLSRRCLAYEMQGLSFREYMQLFHHISLEPYSLSDLLAHAPEIAGVISQQCRPVQLFHEYLHNGYYPFYSEDPQGYTLRLEQVTRYVVDSELPQLCGVDPSMVRKIMALMGILANSVPFEVKITTLATTIEVNRSTVLTYLGYLAKAKLINLLYADLKSVKKMQKPDKIYLENPNLLYALSASEPPIGTLRETFAVNQLAYHHQVEYAKEQGDFLVDGKYIFEVGGSKKTFSQIADIPNSYVLADDMELPVGNKLPLWMVGLLY